MVLVERDEKTWVAFLVWDRGRSSIDGCLGTGYDSMSNFFQFEH